MWNFAGPMPMPWSEIDAWLRVRGHTGAFRDFVVDVVRQLDGVWLSEYAARNKNDDA